MISATAWLNGSAKRFLLISGLSLLFFIGFFSPALFHNLMLAPADGLTYHLAYFYSKKVLWDTFLGAGYPMTADPQVMTWYPPAVLLSFLPGGWNLFVISAYVMASCFTYGYVYTLTQSRVSALVSGLIYGTCGFMFAHLGHTAIIHAAAWPPLMIWSLEMLRRKPSRGWFFVAAVAIACCVFAGHLQIVAYGLVLAGLYVMVLGWSAPVGRARFFLSSAAVFVLGLALTALQILPAAQLAGLAPRADVSTYWLPFSELVLFIFPAAMGGVAKYGAAQYFGKWNLTELTVYVGLMPMVLAAIGFISSRRRLVSIFWLGVALLSLLLILGDRTPLAWVVNHLPVFGRFRAPARHAMELSLAVAVLAGIGVSAFLRGAVTSKLLMRTLLTAGVIILLAAGFLLTRHNGLFTATDGAIVRMNALPWRNPAVATPFIIFILGGLALSYWRAGPRARVRTLLVVGVLVIDMGSFAWLYEWRNRSPQSQVLSAPATSALSTSLIENHQRLLPTRGVLGKPGELPPNLSRYWRVPSAGIYGPLTISRFAGLMSMRADSSVDPVWKDAANQALNLAGVRYVSMPLAERVNDAQGISWNADDMNFWLGGGCADAQSKSIKFEFGAPVNATAVGIVSRLACSTVLPDGAEVARVTVTDSAGKTEAHTLAAGRDTSEWAYDCAAARTLIKHQRSQIFSSFPAELFSQPCEGHLYSTLLSFPNVRDVQGLELAWIGQAEAISINKLSLVNPNTRSSVPLDPIAARSDRWQLMEESGSARIYQNLRVLRRAWLTSETVTLEPDKILNAIRTSRLPDGRPYDPTRMALLEDSQVNLPSGPRDLSERASVTKLTDTTMEVETYAEKPSFLVTSDVYYPGWRASVDGLPAQIFVANYALRGVQLSAGRHQVRFEFAPRRFYLGAGITGLSLAVLLGIVFVKRWWREPSIPRGKLVDNQKPAE